MTRAVPIPGICIGIGPIPTIFDGIGISKIFIQVPIPIFSALSTLK